MDGGIDLKMLPHDFVERMSRQLGYELSDFLLAMDQPSVRGIRMNKEKPFEGMDGYIRLERVPWCMDGYFLPQDSKAGATVFHEAGAFYLQEPSAMLPAEVMKVLPGEHILDLCSAPGGKGTQMALRLNGKGFIVCNEPVPKRAAILSRNMERMGITNSIVTCCYPERIPESWHGLFDGVLADVPCSGEGMFRRDPETRSEWTQEKASGCTVRQREILNSGAKLVRPGGRLVYATCTYNPDENEKTVEMFLDTHPDFFLEPFHFDGADGRNGMLLCLPHRMKGEGQFVAKLRKKEKNDSKTIISLPYERPAREETELFRKQFPGLPVPNVKAGSKFACCPECPELKGIRVLRAGLHLAEIRGKIVIPDHAAAVSCIRPDIQEIRMTPEEAKKYIAGAEIQRGSSGWTLMTFSNLRLGWGKGSDGYIKNHYPKGLRKQNILTEPEFWI